MEEDKAQESQADAQTTNETKGPSPKGKAPFLVFAFLAFSLGVIILALVLFGPSNRLPNGRPAPAPAAGNFGGADSDSAAQSGRLVFEEHLGEDALKADALDVVPEVRGTVSMRPVAPLSSPGGLPQPAPGDEAPDPEGKSGARPMADIPTSDSPAPYKIVISTDALEAPPAPPPAQSKDTPCLAIVIDDLGDSPAFAKALLNLDFPVTLAILPHRTRSRAVAELAAARGAEVLLHQPMEPLGYPGTDPGKGALFMGMPPVKIKAVIEDNLARVPGASGVNNHMGSRFTQDAAGMMEVLTVLHARGLYFLDSVTTNKSAARAAAGRAGASFYSRSVFLDNSRNARAIARQLETAERIAKKHGRAVAIGHPYKETLAALRWWAQHRDPSVRMVSLGDLPPGAEYTVEAD